jgi:hypothetical protein
LPGKDANLDLGLIEPTGVFGREVDGEAIPQLATGLCELTR